MKWFRLISALLLLLSGAGMGNLWAQEGENSKWNINGYQKFLQLTTFAKGPTFPLTNNFFHNRLNAKYYANDKWSFVAESRTRLFYGEQLKLDSTFADQIDRPMGLVDLSVRWVDNRQILLHSLIDRAYVNYANEKWDIRLGRQRINWGLNLVWNPNDLFNALNFLDFDYEERPGNDAIRIQYYTGLLSSLDIAFAPDDTLENSTAGILYKFNTQGYDLQSLVGYYKGDLALGGGWAGNLGNAGFKGEGTVFVPLAPSEDSISSVNLSATIDYLFGNGLYMSTAFLYNSNGKRSGGLFSQSGLFSGQPSPKNLFPSIWSFVLQANGNISPIFTGSGVIIYSPESDLTILVPSITYSIKENWDLDLIGQSLLLNIPGGKYQHAGTSIFIRLKFSY